MLENEHRLGGVHAYEDLFGSRSTVDLPSGSRIAQLVIERCYSCAWQEVDDLTSSEREDASFGSSGI